MKSDEKYIESVRNAYENRSKRAVYCIVFALFVIAAGFVLHSKMQDSIISLQETQSRMFKEGIKITEMDLKLIEANNELAYAIGIKVGMVFKSFAIIVGGLIGYAIYFFIGSRKDRLLLKYYDGLKSHN
jgi:hypothetical protein